MPKSGGREVVPVGSWLLSFTAASREQRRPESNAVLIPVTATGVRDQEALNV